MSPNATTKDALVKQLPSLHTVRLGLERLGTIRRPEYAGLFSIEDLQILHNKRDPFDGAGPDGYILGHYGPSGIHWGIRLKDDARLIGICQFHDWDESRGTVKTSYIMESGSRGQGFMTEAMKAMLSFAFEHMGIRVVRAETHSKNTPSVRLLERLGFRESGRHKNGPAHVVFGEGDELVFSLSKEDYDEAASKGTA